MTNHLRIILKHLTENISNQCFEISGNYKVGQVFAINSGSQIFSIYHLKFKGKGEVLICKWDMQEKSLLICDSAPCPETEIIFVMRTINKLGYEIKNIKNCLF